MLCLGACAQLGGKEGGGENLPNRGIGEYDYVGSPLSLSSPSAGTDSFSDPTALLIDSKVHLYVSGKDTNNADAIFLFVSEDDGRTFGEGILVAVTPETVPNVQGTAAISCFDNQCLLAASSGENGAIYLADGPPSGPFVWRSNPIAEPQEDYEAGGLSSPSVIVEQDSIKLYYAAQSEEGGPRVIAGGEVLNGSFERWGVLLSPSTGCTDSSGNSLSCWNELEIGSPEVKVAQSGTGRTLYRMFFSGTDGNDKNVGFAASFDGQGFEIYEYNPVLSYEAQHVSNIRVGDSYLMYYVPAKSTLRAEIRLAINERGNATETF